MPIIKPISDLRDYNKVLKDCKDGEPVYLTKNGHGVFVVLDVSEYERQKEYLESICYELSKKV